LPAKIEFCYLNSPANFLDEMEEYTELVIAYYNMGNLHRAYDRPAIMRFNKANRNQDSIIWYDNGVVCRSDEKAAMIGRKQINFYRNGECLKSYNIDNGLFSKSQ
jgi:antitoxin component YwqK of YwqJK toxin-antitoxin module